MRRSYISPEYEKVKRKGTLNMLEESTFFSAKMLEIEDILNIDNIDIIWYQKLNNEQIDLTTESTTTSYIYSPSSDKLNNHTLVIDSTQTKSQLDKNTRWIMEINLKDILSNYLFATIKKNRTFEGVRNDWTIEKDVDIAIRDYIRLNIEGRYKYSSIKLYIVYRDLRNQNLLRFKNKWTQDANIVTNKFQTETSFDQSKVKIIFNQEKPSNQFAFDYYFDVIFEKI